MWESNTDCNAENLGEERLRRALPLSWPRRELGSPCPCWVTARAVLPSPTHLRPCSDLRAASAAPCFLQAKKPLGGPLEAPGRAPVRLEHRGSRPVPAAAAPARPFRRAAPPPGHGEPRPAPGTTRTGRSPLNVRFPHFLTKYFCH